MRQYGVRLEQFLPRAAEFLADALAARFNGLDLLPHRSQFSDYSFLVLVAQRELLLSRGQRRLGRLFLVLFRSPALSCIIYEL